MSEDVSAPAHDRAKQARRRLAAVACPRNRAGPFTVQMLREANALVRAAAYKKRVEMQNQDATEAGLEAVRALVFDAMAREQPELYKQVNDFLNAKKREGLEKG